MKTIPCKDVKRLLEDAKSSTLITDDELSFLRITLRLLADGFTYQEALECTYAQMGNSIYGE